MCRVCDRPSPLACEAAAEGGLGKNAKYVDARSRRFAHQRVAASLVPTQRVRHCLWTVASHVAEARVVRRSDRARLTNLQTCGSVWSCSVCSSRISELRRQELNHALAWARRQSKETGGLGSVVPVMLTLTMRHGRDDELQTVLAAMKQAKRFLRQSRAWRRLKPRIVGTVTATELTHGRNGWHPHFHELVFVRAGSEREALELLEQLRSEWLRSLAKLGRDGDEHAFDLRGAAAAGRYIGKFGAAEELALGAVKSGRRAQRTPAQLLAAAAAGDEHAGALWAVYARTFKGRRQLVWSDGFKRLVGVGEVSDDEAAEADQTEDDRDFLIHAFPVAEWREILSRPGVSRAGMLEAAEAGGREALLAYIDRRIISRPSPVSRHAYRSGAPPPS